MLQNGMVVGAAAAWDKICEDSTKQSQREALAAEIQRAMQDRDAFQAALDEADAQDGEGAKHLTAILFAQNPDEGWEAMRSFAARVATAAGVLAVSSNAKAYSEISLDEVASVLTKPELAHLTMRLSALFEG